MRAVVDTNILVRALIKPQGTVGPVLHRLREGAYRLLYSESLLAELVDVLGRPRIRNKYGIGPDDIAAVLTVIDLRGELVVPQRHIVVCRDPKDNQVLEATVAGRADIIVSGDDDLLVLNPFEGIPIAIPSVFLALLDKNRSV
ncbi:MAG: putative toxin-antitoxin system toxin component, PIN family [Herpetosiphonaceae bacterium]|nr:putative toxin-antitoxin system toxin component, PIN family [Herpetosiphonaceae bacterium]